MRQLISLEIIQCLSLCLKKIQKKKRKICITVGGRVKKNVKTMLRNIYCCPSLSFPLCSAHKTQDTNT